MMALVCQLHAQKKIYIPEDLRKMDLQADTSQWSLKRSVETDDLIFMWERGFGNDTANPPLLDGKPMAFSMENLCHKVQSFYTFFRDTLEFSRPGSKCDDYKMMVMVTYSLDGTAYGGTYDNFIGALWVAPNRIQDTKMNCMAHELGHSFQLQIPADSVGDAWGGSGFFEMTSQWMLWQVNPDWLTDENYHFEVFRQLTHKAFLHLDNIYHSPYVIQWWSDLHGRKSIAELYRQGRIGEDPVMTYKRMNGLSQQAFCDEMFRGYQHLVNFDFKHARRETRKYACTFDTQLTCANGWYSPNHYPEEYGFNAILLDDKVDLNASSFGLQIRGENLRYGFVGITTEDEEIYGDINAASFTIPQGKRLRHLYLIVMGAPTLHEQIPMPTEENPNPKTELKEFPYSFKVSAQLPGTAQWNTPGAGNPFIPGYFADPTIRKFGDTYYLYATTDGTGNGYGPAQVWVSKDFCNWKNLVMNWPTTEVVWAPDVVQQTDGTFRYYYCEPCNINVGESQSPIGPWHNILGKEDAVMVPDRYVHNVITLDPQLFRDDDGQEYLYFTTWGIYDGFGCGVAKLSGKQPAGGDARSWHEDAPHPIAADEFFSEKRLIPNTELKDIFEAPFVFKRGDTYYFTYSSGSCHDHTYRVQYATSKVGPMGPFEYKGCILETNADGTVHGPGHHSILEENGRYYIVYHRHNNPHSVHGFNRQVCIDELLFDANGNILQVVPTHDAKNVGLIGSLPHKNLAFGAKVTASSYYDDWFKPEYAVDDNNGTLWKARRTNWDGGEHDEWLQIDLGKATKFSEVWIQFEYPTFFYQYMIETSVDGKKWTVYANRTANTMQGSPMIDRKKAKARYLRITITDTQKNGHMPAIWNVKVWQKAPQLPDTDVESNDGYPGMHQKDVEPEARLQNASITFDARKLGEGKHEPMDVTEVVTTEGSKLIANKPLRLRIKDGRWALFFNGSQSLSSEGPLSKVYRYNAPYTISAWALQTEVGPVPTLVSLSSSHADLATTQLRLGSDKGAGIVSHNGTFESCGVPEAVKASEGHWHHWVVTFDGWKESVYRDGELLHEQNNFIMVRPEGKVVIGADGNGANFFRGYLSELSIKPWATTADEVKTIYDDRKDEHLPSLGDDDFDESDPDSRFSLAADMRLVFEKQEEETLSATSADFLSNPLKNGGHMCREVEGDFVMMAHFVDMEGLEEHKVKGYNECGLLVSEAGKMYQLGVFPLYNCGNMFTINNGGERPQYPNYKGYEFDRILQFERRGNLLFARTSNDGKTWHNMPGSPVEVAVPRLHVGIYQTTYSGNLSWAKLKNIVVYQR